MPNFTSITIKDGAATPADHVFSPLRNPAGSAEWAEYNSLGTLTSRNLLDFTQKLPGKNRGTLLNEMQIVLPNVVTETINGVGVDVVKGKVRVVLQVIADPQVPESLRKNGRVMGANLLLNAQVAEAFDKAASFN